MAIDRNDPKYKMKNSPTMGDMFYFFDKADEHYKNLFVKQEVGMSLISDTTVTAINQHLSDIAVDDSQEIYDAIDDYFDSKMNT